MNDTDVLVNNTIAQALDEIKRKGMSGQIVSVALYYDHESPAISICADTLENSYRHVAKSLSWDYDQLAGAIIAGNLGDAALFNSSVGRSLSLGDFSLVNLARTELGTAVQFRPDNNFFVSLARGLHRNQSECFKVCDQDQRIQFACSTANNEVGLFWSPPNNEN